MTWGSAFAPLRNRNFAWYYASRFVDTLGSNMARIALAFAVLEIGDATAVGQALAAHTIPLVVFMLYGGVIADRFPRALVMQLSNLVAALTQGVLAYLFVTGSAELWMVLVLAALNGTADAAGFPAMAGMVPQLVPRGQLQPANALLSLSRGALTILGPTVARPVRGHRRPRLGARRQRVDLGRRLAPAGAGADPAPAGEAGADQHHAGAPSRAGACSSAPPGCGWWCSRSASSTRSTPARCTRWDRRSPRRPSASRAGASCSPRRRPGCC